MNKGDCCVDECELYGMWKKILEDVVLFFVEGIFGFLCWDFIFVFFFVFGYCVCVLLMSEYSCEVMVILGIFGFFFFLGCIFCGFCVN